MHAFVLEVSHAQVAVFDPHMERPFNDWSDDHVRQGFTWRPGSVSFRTIQSAGTIQVRVESAGDATGVRGLRTIVVSFTVSSHGEVEAATIAASEVFQLQPGEYELTFDHGLLRSEMWARLVFRKVVTPVAPRIVVADAELSPPARLIMSARPA